MLLVSWIYMIHNLIITFLTLEILRQLFFIKVSRRQKVAYIVWMQIMFIINDFVIQTNFELQYKYIFLFLAFVSGFLFILRLPLVASVLVMIMNLIINGLSTNLNIFILLLTQFDSYGLALESDFIQYTSLVMVTVMFYLVLKTFNVRILDISRYN